MRISRGMFVFVVLVFLVQIAQADVIYFSDFEDDNGGMTGNLDWEWGEIAWTGGSCYNESFPPDAAYSGTHMWGTVMNDCYSDLSNNADYSTCVNENPDDDSILSLEVDLSGYSDATLSFYEWQDIFMNWDWAEVYANDDVIYQHCGTGFNPTTEWELVTLDLTPYTGGTVTIEFHLMTSSVVNHAGWYIDDLMIDNSTMPTSPPTQTPTPAADTPTPTPTSDETPTPTPTCMITCPPDAILEGEPACGSGYVDTFNGGCNSSPPVFGSVVCGDTVCGESGTFDSGNRDTDWYEINLTESTHLQLAVIAAFPSQIAIIDPDPDCSNWNILTYSQDEYCTMHSCTADLDAGTYWLWVGPSAFSDWPCVLPYVMYVDCFDTTPTPQTPTSTPTSTPTADPPTYTPTPTPTYQPPTFTPTPTSTNPPPTFTFTCTPTMTPIFTETPLPTSTPECTVLGCTIYMPSHDFEAGDECCCHVTICNLDTDTLTDVPVFVLLDVYGEYFFAPDFSAFNHYTMDIPPGQTFVDVLPMFNWPAGVGSATDICWYAAMTDESVTTLVGEFDMFEFGWH